MTDNFQNRRQSASRSQQWQLDNFPLNLSNTHNSQSSPGFDDIPSISVSSGSPYRAPVGNVGEVPVWNNPPRRPVQSPLTGICFSESPIYGSNSGIILDSRFRQNKPHLSSGKVNL